MEAMLDENGMLEYVKVNIPQPRSTDTENLA